MGEGIICTMSFGQLYMPPGSDEMEQAISDWKHISYYLEERAKSCILNVECLDKSGHTFLRKGEENLTPPMHFVNIGKFDYHTSLWGEWPKENP